MGNNQSRDPPKSLRSQNTRGSSERRAVLEKIGNPVFDTRGDGIDRRHIHDGISHRALESIGMSPRQTIADLAASRTEFAPVFFDGNASDEFSSALKSLTKDSLFSSSHGPFGREKACRVLETGAVEGE